MMVMLFFCGKDLCKDLCLQVIRAFDRLQDHLSVKLGKRCGDDRCICIVLTDQFDGLVDLLLAGLIGPCKKDGSGILDLVHKELTEVLQVHLCLGSIHDRNGAVELHFRDVLRRIVDRAHDIVQLADTGGLDQDPFRLELLHDLL